jgi:hypothetical protein
MDAQGTYCIKGRSPYSSPHISEGSRGDQVGGRLFLFIGCQDSQARDHQARVHSDQMVLVKARRHQTQGLYSCKLRLKSFKTPKQELENNSRQPESLQKLKHESAYSFSRGLMKGELLLLMMMMMGENQSC